MPRATRSGAGGGRSRKSAASSTGRTSKAARTVKKVATKAKAAASRSARNVRGRSGGSTGKATTKKAASSTRKAKSTSKAKSTAKSSSRPPAKKTAPAKPGPGAPKKAPAKTTRPAKKAAGRGDKFLEDQRALLMEERATYTRQAETLKAEADSLAEDMEPGDVQFDEESGEGDTVNVERERDLALSAQARAAVEEIDAALAKIDAGTYGVCEQCGEPIPKERLKAIPYAALCVRCKSGGLGRR
jgi:RNA polymerase-binding protein DksA